MALVHKVEVGIRVVEVLGNTAVGARIELAFQEFDVVVVALGLGVDFRVGRHFQMEVIAKVLADKGHQFIGVYHLVAAADAGGHVAAQGNDAVDTGVLVFLNQFNDGGFVITAKGQVRCHGYAFTFEVLDDAFGVIARGATGAVGDGEEVRGELGELLAYVQKFFPALVGFGGEEFET